jgi:hypothetical protein
MPGAIYLPVNIVDNATVTSQQLMSANLPASNVKIQGRGNYTRLNLPTPNALQMSWATPQSANMIAACLHNLSSSGVATVLTYTDAAFTTLQYNGINTAAYANTGISSLVDYNSPDFQIFRNTAIYFPLQTGFRSAQIIFNDTGITDGYLQVGRLAMGVYKQFKFQDAFGDINRQTKNMTEKARAKSGAMIIDKGANYNFFDIKKAWVDEAADWADFEASSSALGMDKEFFYSQYPGLGTFAELYHQSMVTFGQMSAFDRWVYGLGRTSFGLEGI